MTLEYFIFFICVLGCGYTCWKAGIKEGAERAVDMLHRNKVISYTRNGEIIPNPLFKDYK